MTLLSEIYDVTLKRNNRASAKNGWVRATIGEYFVTHKDFKQIRNNVLRVGVDKEFTTIRSAMDAAIDGDKIIVDYGTYNEYIPINKGICISGIRSSETGSFPVINAPVSTCVDFVNYSGDYVPTIENFTINSAGTWTTAVHLANNFYGTARVNKCNMYGRTTQCYPLGRQDTTTGTACNFEVTNSNFGRGYTRIRKLISGTDTINSSTYSFDVGTTGTEIWAERLCTGTIAVDGTHVRKRSLGIEGYGYDYGESLVDTY